ncbi:MAG: MraY family glycosyltransferase [bacterium]
MFEWWVRLLERYPEPWALAGFALVLSCALTGVLRQLALKRHLLPSIRTRDMHTVRKPRVGGVAMWLTVVVTLGWLLTLGKQYGSLDFGRPPFLGIDGAVWGLLGGMTLLLIVGLWDDLKGVSWQGQLAGQLVAGLILVAAGVTVPFLRLPWGGELQLGVFWSDAFTVVWVMIMINVMNWFDGLDGLAGSIALTASVTLFLLSLQLGLMGTATLSLLLFGVTLGFLPWNWFPSKLFMGTVGSQLLGFLLAVIAIISGGKVATAALVMGIPVLDALVVIFRRLRARQSPFMADQRHLHHRLMKIGFTVPQVVILINAFSLTFGLLAVRGSESADKGKLAIGLVVCMTGLILVTYALEQRALKRVN